MDLRDRLNLLLSREGITQRELADAIDVSRQAVQFWCSGRSVPKGANLMKLCSHFGVSPEWLRDGVEAQEGERIAQAPVPEEGDEIPEGYVAVPEYRLAFHATPGACYAQPTWEELNECRPLLFRRSFLQRWHTTAEHCRVVPVEGDSMEPVLFDGDKVLFRLEPDPKNVRIVDGAVYAISFCGDLKLKRLYRKADGSIIIRSDNPRYPDETLSGEERDLLYILGRVINKSGDGGL